MTIISFRELENEIERLVGEHIAACEIAVTEAVQKAFQAQRELLGPKAPQQPVPQPKRAIARPPVSTAAEEEIEEEVEEEIEEEVEEEVEEEWAPPVKARSTGRSAAVRQPAGRKPAVKQPAGRKPAVKQPVVRKPAVNQPAAGRKPAGRKPGTKRQAPREPVVRTLESVEEELRRLPVVRKRATRKPVRRNVPERPEPEATGHRSPQQVAELGERFYEAVLENPGATMSQLSSAVGVPGRKLRQGVIALRESGRVRTTGERQFMRYYPGDEATS